MITTVFINIPNQTQFINIDRDKDVDLVKKPNDKSLPVLCDRCKISLILDNLSAKRFLDDINNCIENRSNKYIRYKIKQKINIIVCY